MPVHIVVGGQYGSEGKGKVSNYFAKEYHADMAVKVSGINSGHTVYDSKGQKYILRVLPAACVDTGAACVIPAGAVFRPDILFKECEEVGFSLSKLYIHPNAGIITDEMENFERWNPRLGEISSTASGTGTATISRLSRDGSFVRACNLSELDKYLVDTTSLMRGRLKDGWGIVVEGGQGYGLSAFHTKSYLYCTSRDTTAAAFLSEAGLGIKDVGEIILVIRSFEIRVAGSSGPMFHEITWDRVTKIAKSPEPVCEHTSVTHKVRRVGTFDSNLVRSAIEANTPTKLVLNFLDYIGEDVITYGDHRIGPNRYFFIDDVENAVGMRVTHVGFDGETIIPINECPVVMY